MVELGMGKEEKLMFCGSYKFDLIGKQKINDSYRYYKVINYYKLLFITIIIWNNYSNFLCNYKSLFSKFYSSKFFWVKCGRSMMNIYNFITALIHMEKNRYNWRFITIYNIITE